MDDSPRFFEDNPVGGEDADYLSARTTGKENFFVSDAILQNTYGNLFEGGSEEFYCCTQSISFRCDDDCVKILPSRHRGECGTEKSDRVGGTTYFIVNDKTVGVDC